jgi:hypothetical protein
VKSVYRHAKLTEKKGKENFHRLVENCLSAEEGTGKGGLTPDMIRKFSRRARHYILAYFWIEHDQEEKIKEEDTSEINIKRVKKEFKTHWNAIDFDEKFINCCFKLTGQIAGTAAISTTVTNAVKK